MIFGFFIFQMFWNVCPFSDSVSERLVMSKIKHRQLGQYEVWQLEHYSGLSTLADGCCWRSQIKGPHIAPPRTFVSVHIWSGSSQGPSARGYAGADQEHRIDIHRWQDLHIQRLWCMQVSVPNFSKINESPMHLWTGLKLR